MTPAERSEELRRAREWLAAKGIGSGPQQVGPYVHLPVDQLLAEYHHEQRQVRRPRAKRVGATRLPEAKASPDPRGPTPTAAVIATDGAPQDGPASG